MIEIQSLPGFEGYINPLDEARLRSDEAREIFEAKYGSAPWMEDYWTLCGEGWPWRQAAYINWASQPRDRRSPATQGELATQELGLTSDRVIRKWRSENPAVDVRIRALTISQLAKARSEVFMALIEAASNPNPRCHADRKMALEMLGDYVPKQRVLVGDILPDDLSQVEEGDLRALVSTPGGISG
jgi:hypothetical protein